MKRHLQFYLTVIIIVALFDVVASFASRIFLFDYTKLFWVSWCINFMAGFVGYKRLGFVGGVVAGFAAGFGDATLGWFLSMAISPYIRHPPQQFGILIIIITVVMVSTLGIFFGLIGAIVSKLVSGRSSIASEQAHAADRP